MKTIIAALLLAASSACYASLTRDTVKFCDPSKGKIRMVALGGTAPYSYVWQDGSTSSFRDSLPFGTYSVTITDTKNCTATRIYVLTGKASSVRAVIDSKMSCDGKSILRALVFGYNSKYSTSWGSDTLIVTQPGIYSFSVMDSLGCRFDTSVVVQGFSEPERKLSVRMPECPQIQDGEIFVSCVQCEVSVNGRPALGNRASGLGSGEYIIEINYAKCYSTDTVNLFYINEECVVIPNVFSPNGDGVNDSWDIQRLQKMYPDCKVEVYDRWGRIVFESIGYSSPWDGRKNGIALPIDSYHYIIMYAGNAKIGQVTIVK